MNVPITAACLVAAMTLSVEQPKEFGAVRWGRQLQPALDAAAASKKPVMLLFQEVPG